MNIECVVQSRDALGEGVLWNGDERRLYWVDALAGKIRRWDPASGAVDAWQVPEFIGSLTFDRSGGIVAGLESGFCRVSLDPVAIYPIVNPQPEPGIRFNDGKCDRRGRYFVGTMHRDFTPGAGKLWRLDADLSVHEMESGIIVPNGLAWSPDNRTMYFADTRSFVVYTYDYDIETGDMENRRVFLRTDETAGRVDGATVDAEGYYWCAMVRGGAVHRYAPDGRLDRRIELPVMHPTMCTFGGDRLDTLYVTTASMFLRADEAKEQPLAGCVFAITGLGVSGLPETRFAG